jgi:hypothetical protein
MDKVVFITSGDGYWSTVAKAVEITDMRLGYVADDKEFGELRVYFNTATWDVNTDGLIYTDGDFEFELREFLTQHGLAGSDVGYSEQGMQGDDYVSLDVGKDFIASWEAKFGYANFADVHVVD